MSLLLSLISVLPIILIGLYIYEKDKEKEPLSLLLKLFIFGIISCFPAIVLGLFIGNYFLDINNMGFVQLFMYIFIAVAFVEEICKWFFVYRITYYHSEFDTLYDMIIYSSFVALGFACFENILYVQSLGLVTGIVRAVSAVPGHVCDGILMGFYLGLSKVNKVRGKKILSYKYIFLSILIPVVTHCIYDFCLFCGSNLFIIIFSIFLLSLINYCLNKVKLISNNDIKIENSHFINSIDSFDGNS